MDLNSDRVCTTGGVINVNRSLNRAELEAGEQKCLFIYAHTSFKSSALVSSLFTALRSYSEAQAAPELSYLSFPSLRHQVLIKNSFPVLSAICLIRSKTLTDLNSFDEQSLQTKWVSTSGFLFAF